MHTEVKSVHHIHVFARPTPRRDHGRIILSLRNRRRQTRINAGKATHGTNDGKEEKEEEEEEESYEKFVHKITTPRVEFGTKIHRTLHHHAFSKHKSYAYQWEAFCARSERYDYRDVVSEEAETFLSAFHFKLEDGCKRFERDVKTGKAAKDWDAASANHPTLGLVAIVASWKATVEAVCGKPWLFEDEEEQE